MDTYSILREFADSWGLLAMFFFFVGIVLFTFRPGSKATHSNAANIPLRSSDRLEEDLITRKAQQRQSHKEART